MKLRRPIPLERLVYDPDTKTFKVDPPPPPPRPRCWFHRWQHVQFIGLAFLVEHQRCEKCERERCVQVVP